MKKNILKQDISNDVDDEEEKKNYFYEYLYQMTMNCFTNDI